MCCFSYKELCFTNKRLCCANNSHCFTCKGLCFSNKVLCFTNKSLYFRNKGFCFANKAFCFSNKALCFANNSHCFTSKGFCFGRKLPDQPFIDSFFPGIRFYRKIFLLIIKALSLFVKQREIAANQLLIYLMCGFPQGPVVNLPCKRPGNKPSLFCSLPIVATALNDVF